MNLLYIKRKIYDDILPQNNIIFSRYPIHAFFIHKQVLQVLQNTKGRVNVYMWSDVRWERRDGVEDEAQDDILDDRL